LVVSFDLPTRGFQLEYYLPMPGAAGAGQRTFTYTYSADYPVTALNLEVQEPLGAQGFELEPAADSVVQGTDSLNYHQAQAGPLAQNDTISWFLSYQKTGSGLTVDAFKPAQTPTAAISPTAPGDTREVPGLGIAAASLIVLIAVGAGAFWLGRHAQPVPPPRMTRGAAAKRRHSGATHSVRGKSQPPTTRTPSAAFCHQCGVQLRPDADFCHQCGATVRPAWH
jgi:hypothetical protein